jgi:hypothetical protein
MLGADSQIWHDAINKVARVSNACLSQTVQGCPNALALPRHWPQASPAVCCMPDQPIETFSEHLKKGVYAGNRATAVTRSCGHVDAHLALNSKAHQVTARHQVVAVGNLAHSIYPATDASFQVFYSLELLALTSQSGKYNTLNNDGG